VNRAASDSPSTLGRFLGGAVEIAVAPLDVAADTVHALSLALSEDERQRAGRFAFERDWRRYIVSRGRLRQLLAERLGITPHAVRFVYGRRGKPALAPAPGISLRFNVAHSGELALYAFAEYREVGVDVEAVRGLPDADAIAARFFSRREYEDYSALAPLYRRRAFFSCWTRKEAYIKALGDGLYHPLDAFDVSLAPGEPARILRVEEAPGETCGWEIESLVPAPGYIAAVVVEDASGRASVAAATAVSSVPALP
jgi:4'-phosphopantetheinyl transferase